MAMQMVASQSSRGFTSARRVNRSLTAALEKRALEWMAMRAPRWVTSDRLTILGLCAQIGLGACYAAARVYPSALVLGILCLALNWLGDSMDGTLARVRQQQRPRYGFYVDHVVDIIGATAMMIGLGFSGFVHWQVSAAMLVGFLLLAAESYLATYTLGSFELSHGVFGPTELRILLAVGNLELLRSPYASLFGHRMLLFDVGGVVAAAGMLVMLFAVAARHTTELYRQEPIP